MESNEIPMGKGIWAIIQESSKKTIVPKTLTGLELIEFIATYELRRYEQELEMKVTMREFFEELVSASDEEMSTIPADRALILPNGRIVNKEYLLLARDSIKKSL